MDKAVEHVVKLAKEIPVYRDVTNSSSDPKLSLALFSEDLELILCNAKKKNIGNQKRKHYFDVLKKQLLRGMQGLSPLNPYQAAALLRKNIVEMKDVSFKLKIFSELILPFVYPKDPFYNSLLSEIFDYSLESLKSGSKREAARALGSLESYLSPDIYKPLLDRLFTVIDPELHKMLFAEILEQKKILKAELLASKIRGFDQNLRIGSCVQTAIGRSKSNHHDWINVVSIVLIASSMISKIGATTLREDFQNALSHRNVSFLEGDRFSILKFLVDKNLCSFATQPCNLPSELSPFDCGWSLQQVDFSNLQTINCTFIAPQATVCLLQRAKFENSHFQQIKAENADFSDSEMSATVFERGEIQNCRFNRIRGDVAFRKIYATNSSWQNLIGIFDFSFSRLENVDFRQYIPSTDVGVASRFTTYEFTGAEINEGNFQTVYPENTQYQPLQPATNATFSILARPSIGGTLLSSCDFSVKNYHQHCGENSDGFYSTNVVKFFNLTDASLPHSWIDKVDNPANCTQQQLRFGANLKNVSFPSNFSFPYLPMSKIDYSCFQLFEVGGCGFPHLSESTVNCLTANNCVTVCNNDTILQEEFERTLSDPPVKYIKEGLFDVKAYLVDQGLTDEKNSWSMSGKFLTDGATYDKLYWNDMPTFFYSSDASNLTFTNSLFKNNYAVYFPGAKAFVNSTFANTRFGTDGGLIDGCEFSWSTYQNDNPNGRVENSLRMKNSRIGRGSVIQPGRLFSIEDSSFENAQLDGYVEGFFKRTILKNMQFGTSQGLFTDLCLSEASLVEIHANDDSMLRKTKFDKINTLVLKVGSTINSRERWSFSNIEEMRIDWIDSLLYSGWFENIKKLSGEWKGGGFVGKCTPGVYEAPPPPYVKNVLLDEIIFDRMSICGVQDEEQFKKKLESYGFTLGKNVTVLGYPKAKVSFLPIIAIVMGVVGSLLSLSAVTTIVVCRVKRKPRPENPPENNKNWIPFTEEKK